jgi:hypothetical protein
MAIERIQVNGQFAIEDQIKVVIVFERRKQDLAGLHQERLKEFLQQSQTGLVDVVEQARLSEVLHLGSPFGKLHDRNIRLDDISVMAIASAP